MRLRLSILVVLALHAGHARAEDPSDLLRRASEIRTTPAEMRYKTIPWLTDVCEGLERARQEKRPVFLYTILGDPLEDC